MARAALKPGLCFEGNGGVKGLCVELGHITVPNWQWQLKQRYMQLERNIRR